MRSEECDCILLAAGLSSRTTRNKLLARISGQPLIARSLSHALDSCARVILVLGHNADAVLAAARAALSPDSSTRFVSTTNERYELGMFSSIQTGVRHVQTDWFFVVPADLPDLEPQIYAKVARAAGNWSSHPSPIQEDAPAPEPRLPDAVVPEWDGVRGHPVLINRSVIPAILGRTPDAGPMRTLLSDYDVVRLPLETPAVTLDLDTDEALESYRSSSSDQSPPSP
jgi:molybdenum cofactor cytidylyltransferase